MNDFFLRKAENIIVVSSIEDFSLLLRWSGAILSEKLNLVPIQSELELLSIFENSTNSLMIIDPHYSPTVREEKVIKAAIASGLNWCPLNIYLGHINGTAKIDNLKDLLEWTRGIEKKQSPFFFEKVKCLSRRFLAALILFLCFPMLLLIAVLIKKSSNGPVIFKQTRVGHRGRLFTLYKFRTMKIDAECGGPQWSTGDKDSRAYPFGRFLRKTHLDEIPQLWNIVKGDLCFVGPRPERPEFHNILEEEIPHFKTRTRVKPGITGWAQLAVGYASTIEESKRKADHDLFYIRNTSSMMIFLIVFRTIQKISMELFKWLIPREKDPLQQPME